MKKIITYILMAIFLVNAMGPMAAFAKEIEFDAAKEVQGYLDSLKPTTPVCPSNEEMYSSGGGMCVTDDERRKNSVSIVEEGFGKADKEDNTGNIRICFRITKKLACKKDGKDIDMTFSGLTNNCPGGSGITCQRVTVLLGQGGVSLIQSYVGMIYRWAATMAGIVCVLIMIVSGIQISASGGDTTGMEAARKRITQSLLALAVLFLSAVILYMINPNFFTR